MRNTDDGITEDGMRNAEQGQGDYRRQKTDNGVRMRGLQKTENRKRKTECGMRNTDKGITEDGRQKTEDGVRTTDEGITKDRRQKTECRIQMVYMSMCLYLRRCARSNDSRCASRITSDDGKERRKEGGTERMGKCWQKKRADANNTKRNAGRK